MNPSIQILKALCAGKPWTDEENQTLIADFDGGSTIADLAGNHQHTQGAIRSRLIRLGKLTP